jgi:hypothetical protein
MGRERPRSAVEAFTWRNWALSAAPLDVQAHVVRLAGETEREATPAVVLAAQVFRADRQEERPPARVGPEEGPRPGACELAGCGQDRRVHMRVEHLVRDRDPAVRRWLVTELEETQGAPDRLGAQKPRLMQDPARSQIGMDERTLGRITQEEVGPAAESPGVIEPDPGIDVGESPAQRPVAGAQARLGLDLAGGQAIGRDRNRAHELANLTVRPERPHLDRVRAVVDRAHDLVVAERVGQRVVDELAVAMELDLPPRSESAADERFAESGRARVGRGRGGDPAEEPGARSRRRHPPETELARCPAGRPGAHPGCREGIGHRPASRIPAMTKVERSARDSGAET